MSVTDDDQALVIRLLVDDLHARVGAGYDYLAANNAAWLRECIEEAARYVQQVVDETQQDIHDGFIDTVWPKCPRHKHPLWCRDGAWWCEQDGLLVAPLGRLASAALPNTLQH
jgi:hypothetical protein